MDTRNPPKVTSPLSTRRFPLRRLLFCTVILAITVVAFSPIVHNGFTNFDDDQYVTANPGIQGFSLPHIAKQFTGVVGNFHPLTMLTFMADFSVFGLHPAGYHLTGLLFHLLNCLIVFAFIAALTKSDFTGLAVALLFAVHPLRVESVAWISERKGVVSSLFFFAALWAYVKFQDKGDRRFYAGCLALFVLSLMAKPMAVTLPLVLLLIDYRQGRRVNLRSVVEKWPFFTIAAVFSIIAGLAQSQYGALAAKVDLPLLHRVALPFYGIVFYLYKTIVPLHLCAYYPYTGTGFAPHAWLYPILALCGGVIAFFLGRRSKTAVFGMLFYVVTLLPVLQIVPLGGFAVAERYSYVPAIGIYYLFAMGCGSLLSKLTLPRSVLRGIGFGGMSLIVALLLVLTHERCSVWKDSFSLWKDAIATHPGGLAYANLGQALVQAGRAEEGVAFFRKAVEAEPGYALGHVNLGGVLLHQGKVEEALAEFQDAVRAGPNLPQAHSNLGAALMMVGRGDEALCHLRRAVEIAPDFASAQANLGSALLQSGQIGEAIDHLQASLAIDSSSSLAHNGLGIALSRTGRPGEAMAHFQRAVAIDPTNGKALFNLGQLYLEQAGAEDQAITCFHRALDHAPASMPMLHGLAQAFLRIGQVDSAIAISGRALSIAESTGQAGLVAAIGKEIADMQKLRR